MDIKITYPPLKKRETFLNWDRFILKCLALLAVVACPIVNICVGGKSWSLVVLMGVYTAWTLVLDPDLVEYNRISQFVKAVFCASLLLGLIDWALAPGFAVKVLPIVIFSALLVAGGLFFSDLQRQKQNMMPMLTLILFSFIGTAAGLSLYHGTGRWAMIVMGAVAFGLLIGCIAILRKDFIRELKKRFHIK